MSLFRRALPFWVLLVLAVPASAAHAGLFVSGFFNNAVLEYDGPTGAFVKTFTSGGGLSGPEGPVFGPNGDLFVSGLFNNAVLEYNGTTGAFVKTFTSGGGLSEPTFLTFSPEVSAVPEPPSLLLAALGALTALASAARRRAAAFFRPAKP
jgi:hypothetical protein